MFRLQLFSVVFVVAAIVGAPAAAWAGPQGFVKAKQAELVGLLKQDKTEARERRIETIFDEMLDYKTLSRKSLGRHWDERSSEERQEFRGILKQLVRNAYRKNLDKTLDYNVRFLGESKAKEGILVKTVAKHRTDRREEPIRIEYVVHEVSGSWRIFDIVTEGSSLVNNYRNQFHRMIEKKGFDELLRRMKRKLEKDA